MASRIGTKSGPTTSTLASASLTMYSTSGGGEAPVDVDADGVEQRRAEEHLEVLDAVLVEERDAVAGPDTRRGEAAGDLARPLQQLGPADGPLAEDQRRVVGAFGAVDADDVRHAVDLVAHAVRR